MGNPIIQPEQINIPGVLSWGLLAARPAASGSGKYYFVTDVGSEALYQDQGSWVEVGGGGAGAVTSVNGQTGVVVLDAGDVGADPSGSADGKIPTILNGGFPLFQRTLTPSTAVAMTDGGYNSPDMWYSLVQGAGATIERAAGIGTSQYSAKIIAGGTTNRYGIAQIFRAEKSFPYRGATVQFQIRIKPTNNAGSGSRDYRVAILEWTGTADAPVKDVVNDWTSSTYTTGNFFKATNTTLVGTAQASIAHGVESVLSVSGAVSTSVTNLIVFVWVEDVPTHAADYAQFGEAIFCEGSTIQTWRPVDDTDECLQYCEVWSTSTLNFLPGFCDTTANFIGVMTYKATKIKTPTITYGAAVSDFGIRYPGGAITTATVIASGTISRFGHVVVITATGTPLTVGDSANGRFATANGYIIVDANLGV